MYKLTIVGAVLVAATSGSIFKHKFAQKLHVCGGNSTDAPPCPGELLEEWADALDRANVTTPEEYLEDLEDYFDSQMEASKDAVVDELMRTYDTNGDGYLSHEEMERYVMGETLNYTSNFTNYQQGTSFVSSANLYTLLGWIPNSRRITQVYGSYMGTFSKSAWFNAVKGRTNLVFVGTTPQGTIVGGFTGSAQIPQTATSTWLSSPNMFVFNLNNNTKWTTSHTSYNIWVNTMTSYTDLIDFGWHNALQFEYTGYRTTVSYT